MTNENANSPESKSDFCDMMCKHAEFPKEEALDGSGSCMTFSALYCTLKNEIVHKNSRCNCKEYR